MNDPDWDVIIESINKDGAPAKIEIDAGAPKHLEDYASDILRRTNIVSIQTVHVQDGGSMLILN